MEPTSPPRPFCVVRGRVPAEIVARAAARFGLEEGAAALPPWVDALLLTRADRDRLREAFGQGPFLTVELAEEDAPLAELDEWLGAPPVEPGFYLSLTTGTAYGMQCAALVCDELARRRALPEERRPNVELCLHEAIANAIVHGNLGISSETKNQPQGYRLFGELLRQRLGDPEAVRRRLDIFCRWTAGSLVIAVVDQGAGFEPAPVPAETARPEGGGKALAGRGFVFMRALADRVTVTDRGRCTLLQFDF
ncbi:ATP-binding protein [Azospirillum thermophilum]|uniref:ATP-binding protein n=1 Tax=Azospirillum thermophilum TaxID=2202148 RepID=A0A2S2CT13_9PROT|nr:ATP-binding protein [Azospirillum thermophilum]AWK87427.1 ATP-binding protein [Azospirillum thermophilum]